MIEKNIESKAFNDFFIKSASAIKNLVLGPDNCDMYASFSFKIIICKIVISSNL